MSCLFFKAKLTISAFFSKRKGRISAFFSQKRAGLYTRKGDTLTSLSSSIHHIMLNILSSEISLFRLNLCRNH